MVASLFFPHEALSLLVDLEHVEFSSNELILDNGRFRYRAVEGARILAEVVDGAEDDELVGKVHSSEHLVQQLGGEILGESLLIDDKAYDIVPGFVCEPVNGSLAAAERELLVALQDELR